MNLTANLLIELGTEELPPKSLKQLSESFSNAICQQLEKLTLPFSTVKSFATPRRIAVLIENLQCQQADEQIEKRGPAISAAYDSSGQPTQAALGWARGLGIDLAAAERLTTDKGEWLLYNATVTGQHIKNLLPDVVAQAIKQLPIPKLMRWGEGEYAFVRPLKRLTVMLDEQVVAMNALGVESSNKILGHRFHSQGEYALTTACDYESSLEQHYVIADFAKRRNLIKQAALTQAAALHAEPIWDDALLDEVTSLVEWPVALLAEFDASFLAVPKEALISTMKDDQRYFPLMDQHGQLLPQFIFITNIESKNPELVIYGNEKVIRPRLADAEFFFTNDKKTTLASRLEKLDQVLFQKELGSIGDKARRLEQLAGELAQLMGAQREQVKNAQRAGLLAKADLVSSMVMEFPEVQGIMGMHYARHDQEPEAVAIAIEAHYHPRFAGDSLPSSAEGAAVAIADKLDTLVGIFAIGQTPRGDRDPFGLRRAAIGLIRILVELKLNLDFKEIIALSAKAYRNQIEVSAAIQTEIFEFLLGRFRAWYQEQAVSVDIIQAVLALKPQQALDFDYRIAAVTEFSRKEEAAALAAANKRVGNILAKATAIPQQVQEALLQEPAEIALFTALKQVLAEQVAAEKVASDPNRSDPKKYTELLLRLAKLRDPIDDFFNQVMVNAEDETIRNNRLALLQLLHQQFLAVADISLLQN